ncbi:stabilizer of axonemal microtubules 2 [Ditylenchus destructor]|nr:stabilizer of axonemal microtubules 2 [Ditylenchus destructor]
MSVQEEQETELHNPDEGTSTVNGEEKCICELCECGNHRCPHEGNLRLSGGIEFSSSEYGKSFVNIGEGERADVIGPRADNLMNVGTFELQTTNNTDFQAWPLEPSQPVRPAESYTKPDTAFDATTTHKSDFTNKGVAIQLPVKPQSSSYLRPDQPFNEISTHQADFQARFAEPVTSMRRPSVLYKSDEPFGGESIQHSDFKAYRMTPPKPFRPKETRHTHDEPFASESVNHRDYKVFRMTPPKEFRPKESRHLSDEPFSATTEHKSSFNRKLIDVVPSFKPQTPIYRRSSQPLDVVTTYQEGFTSKTDEVEKVEPMRHKSHLTVSSNQRFDSATVHQTDYTAKMEKICPAELVLTRRDHSFRLSGRRNGHKYYKKIGPSIPADSRLIRRQMSPVQG